MCQTPKPRYLETIFSNIKTLGLLLSELGARLQAISVSCFVNIHGLHLCLTGLF
jgi:hypothetical protein